MIRMDVSVLKLQFLIYRFLTGAAFPHLVSLEEK
jgi:hypothetical protein